MTRIAGDWLDRPATQAVCRMLEDAGHRALFVGGCVRDALVGRAVGDIDIATDARPEVVTALAGAAGLRAVPTGIDHGTVTVVSDGVPHEVTTFRRDVETDGRRAVVAFADTVEEDARRRDFTMNALYADARGAVSDPLGSGLRDLAARRVRFIEDPEVRIREDYLRILRFFRFHAWYGDPDAGMDADALAAIAALSGGIETLSAERIGHEIKRLLGAPDPAPSVAAMRATGVLMQVLPGADDRALAPLVHLEAEAAVAPDAMRRLAALGGESVDDRLRLSRAEAKRLDHIARAVDDGAGPEVLGYRHGVEAARDAVLILAASLGQPPAPDALDLTIRGAQRTLPVRAEDLIPEYEGAALGAKLKEIEARWIASGFALTRSELLNGA
ncbi:poly(A) polymerase [Oceanicola sp. 22II-s10i]|uniref:CCA tRNA nucleotidyltransferase n=1 Tax=Oceanicola sp. 22II-s10i TaxID=1317116 RepID=UPI000B6B00F5|nr:CCA tRNA nucleotidyltransferase [Oceanicola sp. 22II-s10i]OWU86001.1 poly(A) polymerase [Oceanicola sp. 22II-s10i]